MNRASLLCGMSLVVLVGCQKSSPETPVAGGQETKPQAVTEAPLVFNVDTEGAVRIAGKKEPFKDGDALKRYLQGAHAERAKATKLKDPVVVYAAKSTEYRAVLPLLKSAQRAGFNLYQFALGESNATTPPPGPVVRPEKDASFRDLNLVQPGKEVPDEEQLFIIVLRSPPLESRLEHVIVQLPNNGPERSFQTTEEAGKFLEESRKGRKNTVRYAIVADGKVPFQHIVQFVEMCARLKPKQGGVSLYFADETAPPDE
jgi:biopolymer transport protein ExbD